MDNIQTIEVKVTKKKPYYNSTINYIHVSNKTINYYRSYKVCSHYGLSKQEAIDLLISNGIDVNNMTLENWKDNRYWKKMSDYKNKSWKDAKEEGMSKGFSVKYTYTKKKILEWTYGLNYMPMKEYQVNLKLYYGNSRRSYSFVFSVAQITLDENECSVDDLIEWHIEGLYDEYEFYNMTKEKWDDNNTFKAMREEFKSSIKEYNDNLAGRSFWHSILG